MSKSLIVEGQVVANIKKLAALTGEPEDHVIERAVEERLLRVQTGASEQPANTRQGDPTFVNDLRHIAHRCHERMTPTHLTLDEIVGYDENGMPG